MNRQQKRSDLRKAAKELRHARAGNLTTHGLRVLSARIERLCEAGVLKRPRTKFQRVADFIKGLKK